MDNESNGKMPAWVWLAALAAVIYFTLRSGMLGKLFGLVGNVAGTLDKALTTTTKALAQVDPLNKNGAVQKTLSSVTGTKNVKENVVRLLAAPVVGPISLIPAAPVKKVLAAPTKAVKSVGKAIKKLF